MSYDELLDAESAVAACHRARARAEVLQSELVAEQEAVRTLRRRVDEARDDLSKLQRSSVRSFFARVRGRRDDVLAVERRELTFVEAELATHQSAMRRLSAQFDAARDEAHELAAAEARLAAVTEQRERVVASGGDERAARLRDLATELSAHRAVRDEVRAARDTAFLAVGALDRAIESLGIAEGWSAFDTFAGRDGLAHANWVAGNAKHGQLDRAVEPLAEAHASLLRLRAELTDVSADTIHRPNIRTPSVGLATMDIWFDNVFSDLMVHDRIASSISELERAKQSVDELVAELEPREAVLAERVARLEADRDALLRRA